MQLNASIDQLFANLASVSDNHLRAFTNLLNRTAEVYVPEKLKLPADVGTAIFRSVQEGLVNVARPPPARS